MGVDETNGKTLYYRVTQAEAEIIRQRERTHDLANEISKLQLAVTRNTDAIEGLREDLQAARSEITATRRALSNLAFGAVSASVVFALGIFAIVGHP